MEADEEKRVLDEKRKYFEQLKEWVGRGRLAQASAYFPYYMVACQMLQGFQGFQSSRETPFLNNNYRPNYRAQPAEERRPEQQERQIGIEYVIPPIWKRFAAEILDFFFIFVSKVLFYYITDDILTITDLKKDSVHHVMNILKLANEDYDFAVEIASKVLMLELLNRLGAIFFEATFLSDSLGGPRWGATPGKFLMGLSVVSATNIVPVENRLRETVIVYPGVNISFKVAVLRSAVKNTLFILVFPICIFPFFFQYSRTTYDVISNVIVVERRADNNQQI